MKRKLEKRTISASESKYFIGEMMICKFCQRQQRSNIKKESGWTVIEADGVAFYVCPQCWGNVQVSI